MTRKLWMSLFALPLLCCWAGPLAAQDTCSPAGADLSDEYTSPPLLRNPSGMRSALVKEVARFDSIASDGGRVSIAFFIDAEGTVQEIRLNGTSGSAVTDSIAIRTARYARFYPAYLDRTPICLWMTFPFVVPPTGSSGGVPSLHNWE